MPTDIKKQAYITIYHSPFSGGFNKAEQIQKRFISAYPQATIVMNELPGTSDKL